MYFICENFYIIGDVLDLLLTVTFIYLVFCIRKVGYNLLFLLSAPYKETYR